MTDWCKTEPDISIFPLYIFSVLQFQKPEKKKISDLKYFDISYLNSNHTTLVKIEPSIRF